MGTTTVYLHPSYESDGWQFRPTGEQQQGVRALLSRWGIIGDPLQGGESGTLRWAIGPGIESLGLDWHHRSAAVTMATSDEVQIEFRPDMELTCPRCGHMVDVATWGEGLPKLLDGTEPRVSCGCTDGVPLTVIEGVPGYVVAHFLIAVEGAHATTIDPAFLQSLSDAAGHRMIMTPLKD